MPGRRKRRREKGRGMGKSKESGNKKEVEEEEEKEKRRVQGSWKPGNGGWTRRRPPRDKAGSQTGLLEVLAAQVLKGSHHFHSRCPQDQWLGCMWGLAAKETAPRRSRRMDRCSSLAKGVSPNLWPLRRGGAQNAGPSLLSLRTTRCAEGRGGATEAGPETPGLRL